MKKLLSLLLATMMIIGAPSMAFADNVSQIIGDGNTVVFIDVPANYWAKDQIEYFANQGIVDGYTDGSFKPEAGVTREEFCKLLVSTFKQPLETPDTPTFADVAENRWSYPYVEVCRDFLTGYANPFGGLPSFHPTEYATREDIAVALVRMMGFTDKDANNPNYAAYNFRDGGNISPNILAYVSIACERGLISGYPDGTFGPTKGITRAETVVLLNRATKQAVTNINSELEISANVIYSSDKKTATINIVAEEGTTVTVNGESVKMSSNYYGEYEGNYVYKFEAEGSKDFAVEGKRAGKSKTIKLTAKYEIGAPTLTITTCPSTSDTKTVTIKGTVEDEMDNSPSVTVNGKSVSVWYGDWSYEADLKEGENSFTIVATNKNGKSTTENRKINFGVGAPTLKITVCPTTSDKETVTIKGTVSDTNDNSPSVTVNGESVSVWYGDWSYEADLKEGENKFTIVATNDLGKSTTETRTINFGVGAPTLKITVCPTTSDKETATIKGTVSDTNDNSPSVTVNGESVSVWYGDWSYEADLKEGENKFTIVATNDLGKSTTETRTINFGVSAPTLKITTCPSKSNKDTVTIKGTVDDTNDNSPSVSVNGESVSVWYGDWSCDVELTEGINVITIIATNDLGKSTTEERKIEFSVGAPEIQFVNCPETTKKDRITIKGKIKGDNTGAMLFIDDEEVYVDYSNEFSKTVELKEGSNRFEFRAVNEFGKEITVTKTITYTPESDVTEEE